MNLTINESFLKMTKSKENIKMIDLNINLPVFTNQYIL